MCDAENVCPAPAVHPEYMEPVLFRVDKPLQLRSDLLQFAVGEKAFVYGLLAPGAVALEKMPDAGQPLVARDVIGDEVKCPFHATV